MKREPSRPTKDRLVRWTPPAEAIPAPVDWLALHDDVEGFRVLVQVHEASGGFGRRLRIGFDGPYAYRVADEGRRFSLLDQLERVGLSVVYLVEDSTFLAWVDGEGPPHQPLHHYLVTTTDACVDVLSDAPPTVAWLDPA